VQVILLTIRRTSVPETVSIFTVCRATVCLWIDRSKWDGAAAKRMCGSTKAVPETDEAFVSEGMPEGTPNCVGA